MDDPIKAAEIANASGDKAACYHLARQYENIDNIPEAIHFFSKAQAYSNAIRICKEQGKNKTHYRTGTDWGRLQDSGI